MSLFNISGIILGLVSLIGYINYRWVKLPDVIGMTAISLIMSVFAVIEGSRLPILQTIAKTIVLSLNFPELIFHGFLGILLFAGSMHVNLSALKEQKIPVILLSTVGVILSTLMVATFSMVLLDFLKIPYSLTACMLFGAIISPTDPIAVLAVLKKVGVPESVETKIVGESLFNDGMAVVLFMSILTISHGGSDFNSHLVLSALLREIVGGLIFGMVAGYIGYRILKDVDSYQLEIITTLAMAIGGYAMAESLHVSAPLAVVVMGLFVGNQGTSIAMPDKTKEHLLPFWALLDELLNLILFALIGLEVMSIVFETKQVVAGLLIIPLVLIARAISVWAPLTITKVFGTISPNTLKIMTWGGLRGGISVALAISLPTIPVKETIITMTYIVVVFSLLVQATTLGRFVKTLSIED